MRKGIGFLAVLVVLALPAVAAAKDCRDVAGGFSAGPPPPGTCTSFFCTAGELEGGLKGTYFFTATGVTATGLTGESTITLRSGQQLFGEDVSELGVPNEQGLIPFTTTVNIVGGTGKYDDASGQIVATGLLDPLAGTTVGTYTGTVCKK